MLRSIALPVLGTLLGIGVVPGCANGGDASIIVLRGVAPASTECTFSATTTELTASSGALDATWGGGYLLPLQLTTRVTAATGMENQRLVFVTGALVDIAFPDSTLFSADLLAQWKTKGLTHFKAERAQVINPNGGLSDTSFGVFPGELSLAILQAAPNFLTLNAQVTLKVVGGLGQSGDDLASDPFVFPITVLRNGLTPSKGLCSSVSSSFAPRVGNPCNVGQDAVTDCCTDPNMHLVCPAIGTAP